jgi:hypothetical protein
VGRTKQRGWKAGVSSRLPAARVKNIAQGGKKGPLLTILRHIGGAAGFADVSELV